MSTMRQNEAETLVAELCERFVSLFAEMAKIGDDRIAIREERKNLQAMMSEQKELSEVNIKNLQQEVLEIEKKISEGPNLDDEKTKEEIESNLQIVSDSLSHKQSLFQLLTEKKENLLKSNEIAVEELENKQLSIENLTARLQDIEGSLEIQNERENELQEAISELEEKKSFFTNKIEETMANIEESEGEFKKLLKTRLDTKENYRESAEEFRKLLSENSKLNKEIGEVCKRLVKSKSEADSKEQRLLALISKHEKFNSIANRLSSLSSAASSQKQANAILEENLQNMKSQYEGYVQEPWDYKCEHRIRKMVEEIVKNPSFKPESSICSEKSSKAGKENLDERGSLIERAVEEGNKEKDEEILENEGIISELKKEIREARDGLYSQQLEREVISQKMKALESSRLPLPNEDNEEDDSII